MKRTLLLSLCLVFGVGTPGLTHSGLSAHREVLENGLVLITSEERSLPIISLHLLIRAGSRYDPKGREGLANITSNLLTRGSTKRSANEIADFVDFIGARLETQCRRDLATISLTLLKKDLDAGLELLAELLTQSLFPLEEVEKQKTSIIAAIKSKGENPRTVAREKFRMALFPQGPYGRLVEGSEQSVKKLQQKHLSEFYHGYYRPNRSILAVVGDISQEEMKQKIDHVFRSWTKSPPFQETLNTTTSSQADFIRIDKDLTQANIVMGHAGVSRKHPDYYAIYVMNYILGGGGLSSRLVDSIRNERGLAYSVRSQFAARKHMGAFRVSMQTKNATAQEAIQIATDEIRRIREQPVTEEELESAKTYLIGSFPIRLDTNRSVARFLARLEYHELGLDYPERFPDLIRQVSREDVMRVARAHLHPDKLITVVVANLDEVR